jgi:hypothetical protein
MSRPFLCSFTAATHRRMNAQGPHRFRNFEQAARALSSHMQITGDRQRRPAATTAETTDQLNDEDRRS